MKPVAFAYRRVETYEEAAALLHEHGDEAKVIAGGQSLVPLLNMRFARPALLVDVSRVPGTVERRDGQVVCGATVRQADFAGVPLVEQALPHVGHFVTRNRGTVGGSIAHADAAGELPLCLLVAGGVAVTSAGREIAADDLFVTHFTTSLAPEELLVETRWPDTGARVGFEELAQRHGDYALAMAAAVVFANGSVRLGVGSVVDRPTLVAVGSTDADEVRAAVEAAVAPPGNLHASGRYLRHLAGIVAARAVARAAA